MSTAKHTPGPWLHDELWGLIKGPKGEEVAAIHSGQGDGARVNQHIAHVNAQLMAAAPELLAACKRALEYAPNEIEANALRKAITKAEGKA